MQWDSEFNGDFVSWTVYSLYIPFKLIDDYVMPDYYGNIDLHVNGNRYSRTLSTTWDEQYPYYIKVNFTATAPSNDSWSQWNNDWTSEWSSSKWSWGWSSNWNTKVNVKDESKSEENKPEKDNLWYQEWSQAEVLANWYNKEFNNAYEFAYENWITTMDTIEKADMDWKLTRIAMAKMLSQYAINILDQKPANIVVPNFPDVSAELNEQYGGAVTLAYQLWIMWINIDKFRPDDLVTRWEFATALSRMLFSTSDGEYESTDIYYTNHLKKLVEEKIITNDDPKLQELRGYVMIMLMRSAKN